MNYDCCKSSNSLLMLEHRKRPQSVKSEGGGGVVAQGVDPSSWSVEQGRDRAI